MKATFTYAKKQANAMVKEGPFAAVKVDHALYLIGEADVRTFGEIAIDLAHIDDDMMIQQRFHPPRC